MRFMTAWLFDVDGVITNPQEKRVTQPEILSQIAKRLESGEPVALVTGRSLDFMRERVIAPLRERLASDNGLDNFLAVGEKGGVWITYKDGKEDEHIDSNIAISSSLIDDTRSIINADFSDSMFFDESKKTMISTEMKDGQDLQKYHLNQEILNKKLKKLVDKSGIEGLEIDPTTIATDIQSKIVGKDFAARRVIKWLSEKGISPQQFIAFGDSKSDIPMAEEIREQGLSVKMVFVGKPQDISGLNAYFDIVKTEKLYENGTLEFLQNS